MTHTLREALRTFAQDYGKACEKGEDAELFLNQIEHDVREQMTACRFLGRSDLRDEVIAWLALNGHTELRDQFLEDFPE